MRRAALVLLIFAGTAHATPPPAPHAPAAKPPAPDIVVDAGDALKDAKKLGFKQSMFLANPVKCRAFAAPTTPPPPARRTGDPLPIDLVAFGRAEGRNVASASLGTAIHDTVETVVQVDAAFAAPPGALAAAVGKRLGVAATVVTVDATHVLVDAPAHGRASLVLDARGRVTSISIAR